MITIVLADDHQMVRSAFKNLLELEADLSVVGEAGDGLAAVQVIKELKPHVLILDLMIPKLHGLEVIPKLSQTSQTKILVLSMYEDEPYVVEALRSGASGYILKDSSSRELIEGVRATAKGQLFVSKVLRSQTLNVVLKNASGSLQDRALTEQENLILQMGAEGNTSSIIATKLSLSPRTVESHRASVMRKLGLKTQTDLVRYAVRRKIILP